MRARPADRLSRPHTTGRRRSRAKKKRSLLSRLFRGSAAVVFCLILATWIPVAALRWINPSTTAFMLLDQSGVSPLRHEWRSWPELGTRLPLAVVASEDQKFADHFGFDVASIQSSIEAYGDGERLRGASTISQQVAKNLFLWPGRSFVRKGLEAYFTLLIELTWSKQRVLEVYLNVAEFGAGTYGAGAASAHFFGKAPSDVSAAEAALLAAVLPSPKRLKVEQRTPYLAQRQAWILEQMERLEREGWLNHASLRRD